MLIRWDFSKRYSLLNSFHWALVVKERSKAEWSLTHRWRHNGAQFPRSEKTETGTEQGRSTFRCWKIKKKRERKKERKKENNKEKPNQQNREYLIFIRKWYSYRTRTVDSQNHCRQLQEDLQNLEKWESDWQWIQRRTKSCGFMAQFQDQHLYMLMKQTVSKQWRQQSLSNRTEFASASFSNPGLVAQFFLHMQLPVQLIFAWQTGVSTVCWWG